MKENRSFTRFDMSLTASWQGSVGNHDIRISDLSEGGCYGDTIVEVNLGETLFLKIQTPHGEWFVLQGVVAHHTAGMGFGVRFVNLDEKQQEQIRSLLRKENTSRTESPDTAECHETLIPSEQIDVTSRIISSEIDSRCLNVCPFPS
ncbi:MAG: PilZ domain-containing protein [Acidobacteriota bacterium]|nr:PilZ domain-containing protein [Acidobacteriota bacterium]